MEKKIKTIYFWKFQKTINNIELAKSHGKNSVIIEKNQSLVTKHHSRKIKHKLKILNLSKILSLNKTILFHPLNQMILKKGN